MRESHAKCVRLGMYVDGATVAGRGPAFNSTRGPTVSFLVYI